MSTEAQKEFKKVIDWVNATKNKITPQELIDIEYFFKLNQDTGLNKQGLADLVISDLKDGKSVDDIIDDLRKHLNGL